MNIIYSMIALFTLACFTLAQQTPESVSIRVITTFDYPGAGNSTFPQKINDAGDIVGSYIDSSGVQRGFVRFANGNFSPPIVEPNDTGNVTEGRGINNARLVCGNYLNGSDFTLHGYFLSSGNFSEFDVPGSLITIVLGLNNVADFCGGFTDDNVITQAYVSLGRTITPFSIPGAIVTLAYELNSSNQLVGYYVDGGGGPSHGYFRDTKGALHFPIDFPASTETDLFGNNDSNWIVGRYVDNEGITHGLFFVPPNKFFSFDYPGSTFTSFSGINRQGFICGRYEDSSGIAHGIITRVRIVPSANEAGNE